MTHVIAFLAGVVVGGVTVIVIAALLIDRKDD